MLGVGRQTPVKATIPPFGAGLLLLCLLLHFERGEPAISGEFIFADESGI
jgi:hypothetical protein